MADLGNAYVNIVPKAPGIEGKIEDLMNGGSAGAEKAGQGIGKRLLKGIAGLGIGAAVVGTVKGAMEAGGALQQSFGGLDTIYEKSSRSMKLFAEQASKYGVSANDYAEQAVSFGAALKQAYAGDTTQAMFAANSAIQDMADNAAKMGTPLENIQSAYQGFAKQNYTMLDNLKLGYGGTKSEMERLLADAEAFSGVHYDIDNLGDVYNAIHVIQDELGIAGVAADEAKSTLTGSAAAMKASWENVLGALTTGEGLETALGNFSDSFGNFSTNVINMLAALAPQIPDLIVGLADVIIDQAPTFIASGIELIVKLAAGLIEAIPELIARLPEIFSAIKDAFSSVDWAGLGKKLLDMIGTGINNAKQWLKDKFRSAMDSVKSTFTNIDWAQLGKDLINGIVNGLLSGASWLYESVTNLISNALSIGKKKAEVASPSKLFARELGQWIPAGVAMGIDENMAPVDAAMDGMMRSAAEDVTKYGSTAPAVSGSSTIDYDKLAAALSKWPLQVDIEGDTAKIFRVVQKQNMTQIRATNYNVLAPAR